MQNDVVIPLLVQCPPDCPLLQLPNRAGPVLFAGFWIMDSMLGISLQASHDLAPFRGLGGSQERDG